MRGERLRTKRLLFAGGVIEVVGPRDDLAVLRAAADSVIDAAGCVVTPGLVSTHHHLFQSLTRALLGAISAPQFGWFQRLYPIWGQHRPEDVFAATQLGLAALALAGCTLRCWLLAAGGRSRGDHAGPELFRARHLIERSGAGRLIAGYAVAALIGRITLAPVANSGGIMLPSPFHFSFECRPQ